MSRICSLNMSGECEFIFLYSHNMMMGHRTEMVYDKTNTPEKFGKHQKTHRKKLKFKKIKEKIN